MFEAFPVLTEHQTSFVGVTPVRHSCRLILLIVLEPARKVWVDVRYPVLRRRPHRRPRGLERLGVHGHAAQGAGRAEGVGGEGDAAAPAGAALVRVDGVRVVRVHGEGVRVGGLAHRGVGGVAAEDGGDLE